MTAFQQIIELYNNELRLPINDYCQRCDSKYKAPLLPWQVGAKFFSDNGGVFIAGKPHRISPDKNTGELLDWRDGGEKLYFNAKWPYWSYTKEILKTVYGSGSEGWDHIALTNIVKCSSTSSIDKTSKNTAMQCIVNNQVIFKEIEILKPRKIIFYTWSMYRDLLTHIPFAESGTVKEHTDIKARKKCGKKLLGWWERSFIASWGRPVDFLIVGHPERMKKDEYVSMVGKWLKKP